MSEGSITVWLKSLKGGDEDAVQQLWNRYFSRLVGLARHQLAGTTTCMADEEDAALTAFDSFCRAAEQGRFSQLEDRDDLWQLLVMITVRKVVDQRNYERRQRRGGGRVTHGAWSDPRLAHEIEQVLGAEPTPQLAAEMAEQFGHLMELLDDAELRAIALLKMEGYTNQEVADQLGCARRTVQRRLRLIQSLWEQEFA